MRNLIIRDASADDIPAIVRVRRSAFTAKEVRGFAAPKPSQFYSLEELSNSWIMENQLLDGWRVFVAEENGELIGFIVFKIYNGKGYIDNINISKKHQRTGVGKALVLYVENLARRQGIHTILTDTTENAEGKPWKSYACWIGMGYRDTGERLKTEWSFKEILFHKNIERSNPSC